MSVPRTNFHDLPRAELLALAVRWGFSPVHAARLWAYVYLEQTVRWADMPELPARYRTKAEGVLDFARLPVAMEQPTSISFRFPMTAGLKRC